MQRFGPGAAQTPFDGPESPVQDRLMNRLALLGCSAALLLGCGLRSDTDFVPVCVDSSGMAGGGSGTDGTGDTDGTDTNDGTPRLGSCQNPIDIPSGQSIVVRGSLGGCSGTEGWCGGSGGEDVYRINGVHSDVFIDFRPQETDFNPVLRVVRGDPCGDGPVEESEVCAPIVNSIPGRGFYDQGGVNDLYYIIVDTELGETGKYAFDLRFGEDASQDDCLAALDEQAIEIGPGGNFQWEASLEAEQGRLDSECTSPGSEHIFPLVITGAGTLSASVSVIEGDPETFMPIVSIRTSCATPTELSCGESAVANFGGTTNRLLVVDQRGVGSGRYLLNVDYN